MYTKRYPEIPQSRWALIPNGFDEDNFVNAEKSEAYQLAVSKKNTEQIVLLHSGILYPSERDPTEFFKALSVLKEQGDIHSQTLKIILRATGHDELHAQLIKQYDLQNIVLLKPDIAYKDALAEMLIVDGLLVFQASNCNHQIPAKVYEYLRAKRPIFALTDPKGDTAEVLNEAGVPFIVPLDDKDSIVNGLREFLAELKLGNAFVIHDDAVVKHSRSSRTKLLVKLINEVAV